MAQGKLKVKTKVPDKIKLKKNKPKGNSVTPRSNKPIQKKKHDSVQKMKQNITKVVNKTLEENVRSLAGEGSKNLSRAQQAVAEYHRKKKTST